MYIVHTSYIYVSIVQYKQYTCLTCIPRSSHVTIMWPSCDHYSFLHCRSSPTQQARRALPAVFHKVKNITKRYIYIHSTCLCVTVVHVRTLLTYICTYCTCTLLMNMRIYKGLNSPEWVYGVGYSDMIEVSSHQPEWLTILRRFSSLCLFIYWPRVL